MLDENLPTFYLRSSADDIKHHASVLLSHQGSDALPAYSLRHPDPSLPGSKNRYALALYDSYNPEILFGEVLLIPDWTQPNLNKEELRLNGGALPPPQPVLPTEFVIQLYNPDQQIHVKWINGSWNTSSHFYFEIPEKSFRQPSISSLDRTQSDPTASENTPKLGFKWKKDGKFSKDYVCSLSGKSTNPDGSKRKNREPDITISLFKHFKEITIYEPNLSRVEIEDPKGLEVVLLLGAIVIREVYNSSMHEAFNITDGPNNVPVAPSSHSGGQPHGRRRHSSHSNQPAQQPARHPSDPRPPPTDPRTQWELDVEAARLKQQVEAEERERRRAEAVETKRVKKMVEEEDRRRREKEMEIDRETERLKKLYGKQQRQGLQQPPKPQQQSKPQYARPVNAYPPAPVQRPHSAASGPYLAHNLRPSGPQQQASYSPQQNPYLNPAAVGTANASTFFSSSGAPQQSLPKKSSFWHLGRKDDSASRLSKQKSTVF